MWRKCGTEISNEINKVKKSKLFFGSDIYAKYQFSSVLSGISCASSLTQHRALICACRAVLCGLCAKYVYEDLRNTTHK